MPLESDQIVDRRRMRRKLTFWRVAAVAIAIIAIMVGVATSSGGRLADNTAGAVARIKVSGLIRTDLERVEALERLAKSRARAVIVHVDSPGGTTAGAEQLHRALLELKAKKPMVVVVDGLAASGGYMAAIASDHIVAQSASLVGSIGVLFQYPQVSELMNTLGIKVEEVKSSPLKAAPSAFQPTSPEAREAVAAIVMDAYDWFKDLVRKGRKFDEANLARVSDGRVFTGRQALELKLVDELGDEKTALAWLAKTNPCTDNTRATCVDQNTPIRDYSLRNRLRDLPFLHVTVVSALESMGLPAFAWWLETSGWLTAGERLNLDGLLALWHPSAG